MGDVTSRRNNHHRQVAEDVLRQAYDMHANAVYTFGNGVTVYPSIDQALRALEVAAIRIASQYGGVK